MNILFNCLNSGLGNNGGTNTILKSQKILENMGHYCDVAASVDRFTWFKHKKPLNITLKNNPLAKRHYDWIISSACTTVDITLNSDIKNKTWWIRAHEDWVPGYDDEKLIKLYKKKNIIKIVNSIWQKEFLESLGIKCYMIYQGIDISKWKDLKLRNENDNKITICSLYSKKPRKNWKAFKKLMDKLGTKHYKFVSFGAEKQPDSPYISKYLRNPSHSDLQQLYSQTHIYFAPTLSEGLHNIPMEAALCGAEIVCSDAKKNGMKDYANYLTAIIYSNKKDKNLEYAVKAIKNFSEWKNYGYNDRMKSTIVNKIGNREHNMRKLVKLLDSLS